VPMFNSVPDDSGFTSAEGWITFTIGASSYAVPAWK
jgi:hypothetical protein